ncbi:MAG TPA: MlaD family protein [Solirubrobacteraceae bacterium]|nr:MlaD family protein [Solirubrobacteraceae bacterium]
MAIGAAIAVAVAVVILLLSGGGVIGGGSDPYRVEALFDNAGFAVPGEQVRIAGAPVGTISALSVTRKNLAAVTLSITNHDFTPFYANATCTIRPQSLIAERYVDCVPGTVGHPRLRRITSGYGAGSYLLPVTRTSSPIDPDIVQDISQDSVRESLSLILDELGTGLAARGSDLNAVILRAVPALQETDAVFKLLDSQNATLAKLASNSSTVLAPLARARTALADFIRQANTTATAGASRAAALERSIKLLPGFLAQLKPLMAALGTLAHQGTPVMSDLGKSAGALDAEFKSIVPFAHQAQSALINLGNALQQSTSSLEATQPLADQLQSLGNAALPSGQSLEALTTSLKTTGGIQQLMGLLFYGAGATNGYNADGHYVRIAPIVGSCNAYARTPFPGCSANFSKSASTASASLPELRKQAQALGAYASEVTSSKAQQGATATVAARAVRSVLGGKAAASTAALSGLLRYLIGS